VLDTDGKPVAADEPGELSVRGPHMALGDWQGGRLVTGRLPAVADRPGWRVFHTGDLVRIDADGQLSFVTRADRQIKINGVRIEPAEIESVLRRHPDVADAAIMSQQRGATVALLGFVAAQGADADALRGALFDLLRVSLPSTMRPAQLTVLDGFPTLPGGKIDIVALRALADRPDERASPS
jgi:acyl-coenzyme A synthetase/AMP-(fatty) acid ligase